MRLVSQLDPLKAHGYAYGLPVLRVVSQLLASGLIRSVNSVVLSNL